MIEVRVTQHRKLSSEGLQGFRLGIYASIRAAHESWNVNRLDEIRAEVVATAMSFRPIGISPSEWMVQDGIIWNYPAGLQSTRKEYLTNQTVVRFLQKMKPAVGPLRDRQHNCPLCGNSEPARWMVVLSSMWKYPQGRRSN